MSRDAIWRISAGHVGDLAPAIWVTWGHVAVAHDARHPIECSVDIT